MSQAAHPVSASHLAPVKEPEVRSGPVARHEYAVGDVVDGRYELVRDLGQGAAGVVFEARHRFTHRRVALKIVSPDTPRSAQGELRARLVREARALAAARHPAIVDVLDGGLDTNGTPYIVLEMLEGGRTLEGLLATRGRLSVKDSVAVGIQLCEGLAAVHHSGVVHRDVKPGNIIVLRDGSSEIIKLFDFGIAHLRSREGKLTSHGAIIGTPEYMSPEQLLATGECDHLADVYSVGITLYECIAGRVPFAGNYQQVLLQVGSHAEATPLIAVAPIAGQRLSDVVARAIAKDRHKRYQSVEELAHDLVGSIPGVRRRTQLFAPVAVPSPATPMSTRSAPQDPPPTREIPVEQRRAAVRANYATPVRVILADGVVVDGRSEDVSTGGLLVILNENADIPHDQRVTLRFALPMTGKVVSCIAQIRWVRATQGRRAVGLQFVDPPADLGPQVNRYIELMGVPKQG